jgi:hypothetical protein
MHATGAEREHPRSRAAANDNARTHPAWRRIVAGGMAFVFALSIALFGLMLCVPLLAP